MQYGIEKFVKQCVETGIDGVIIPDLPFREYQEQYAALFDAGGLRNIFLVSPQTSEERIRLIDGASKAFIYMVSSSSTTGAKGKMSEQQLTYFKRIQAYGLHNPTLIGFGISNNETYETACQHSNGAIIGSAFIQLLEKSEDLNKDIESFIGEIRGKELADRTIS
jgi:tryptophan synthase alpha chain